MLQLLPIEEEEPSIVGPEAEPGDGAAASSEWTAEVVPPCLAEVEAVGQGGTGDCSVSCVDGLRTQLRAVLRPVEFGVKIGYQKVSLREQAGAERRVVQIG